MIRIKNVWEGEEDGEEERGKVPTQIWSPRTAKVILAHVVIMNSYLSIGQC